MIAMLKHLQDEYPTGTLFIRRYENGKVHVIKMILEYEEKAKILLSSTHFAITGECLSKKKLSLSAHEIVGIIGKSKMGTNNWEIQTPKKKR